MHHIENTGQLHKCLDENLEQSNNAGRAVRQLAERFALTIPVAITIANLAGLGSDAEARS
jgi:hypothetical protein